jgi:LPS sulfotransferase NodH
MNPVELLGPDYDTPPYAQLPVESCLLICTTPRIGGHALAAAFLAQGWGTPLEYFNPDSMIPLQKRWIDSSVGNYTAAKENLEIYGKHLAEKRSTSHLFSVKLLHDQMALFGKSFGNSSSITHFVHLSRRDRAAQAISLAATLLTRHAFDNNFEFKYIPKVKEIDDKRMTEIFNWLTAGEAFWHAHIAKIPKSRSLHFHWEDFQADTKSCLSAIGEKFSLPFSSDKVGRFDEPYNADTELKMELKKRFGNLLEKLQRDV